MQICKSCGLKHDGWVPCAKARYLVVHTGSSRLVGSSQGGVGLPTSARRSSVESELEPDGQNKRATRHGKYSDLEARKSYRREWMRKRRAM